MEESSVLRGDEVSLYSIIKEVWIHFWIIVMAVASAWIGISGYFQLSYEPEYTASAMMAVYTKGTYKSYISNLSTATQMAGVLSEVFTSNILYDKIAEDMNVSEVNGSIQATVIPETNLMTIQVTSETPKQAYLILNSALNHYDSVSDYLFSNAALRVIKEPTVPYEPSNRPNVRKYQELGAFLSGLLVVCCIIASVIFRQTIQTTTAAKRKLEGKIRGVVPYEWKEKTWRDFLRMKKKNALLICSPVVSMNFVEAYRKIATRVQHHMNRHQQKILLISSVSENEGKSSVAANISLALAEKGKKVLLLDGDLKKPAQYKIFDTPNRNHVFLKEYLEGEAEADELLYYDEKNKLYMIFVENGITLSERYIENEKFEQLLQYFRNKMDFIIVDSAPMVATSDVERLMKLVDTVLFVVRQDRSDHRLINEKIDVVKRNKKDFAGFVLNAFHNELEFGNSRRYVYGYRGRGGKY